MKANSITKLVGSSSKSYYNGHFPRYHEKTRRYLIHRKNALFFSKCNSAMCYSHAVREKIYTHTYETIIAQIQAQDHLVHCIFFSHAGIGSHSRTFFFCRRMTGLREVLSGTDSNAAILAVLCTRVECH